MRKKWIEKLKENIEDGVQLLLLLEEQRELLTLLQTQKRIID